MKKILFITPIVLLISTLSLNSDLKAAGCTSHKNKKVQVECPLTDDNCDINQSNEVDS